jgi:hypothetical protein
MSRWILTTAATLLAAGALGACGSTSSPTTSSVSSNGSTTGASSTTSSTATSTSTTPTPENGIASQPPAAVLAAAVSAATTARTVHVAGVVVTRGRQTAFNVHVVAGQGAVGQLSAQGLSVRFVTVGHLLYLNGGAHFWRAFGSPAIARKLDGRWVQVPPTVNLASIDKLINLNKLFATLLARHETLVKGPTGTIHGQQVLALHSMTRGGTLYVATTGQPYPIEVRGSRAHPGLVVFDQYNEPFSLRAPRDALTASSLGGI